MSGVGSLLFPRSLAVVGASPRNAAAVETVVASGVRAWGVNPNRDEVAGLRCYASFSDLPEMPECAFLMVNHERVEAAFEPCRRVASWERAKSSSPTSSDASATHCSRRGEACL